MDDFAKELLKVDLKDELKKSYLDYAMSVIIGRALPDTRDGFKPVHRRILYAMHELSNSWNRPYKKSARVVGDVIGKYHPHGDTAVYDALVRMAQDFSMRYPLVDGQGNFGSVDGDAPAAMRYTEVRMARIASLMLESLDQDTVDMQANYDGNEHIPEVLPGLLPNLLINGSSGIAVGMATNMPPHNLTEICNACLLLLGDPRVSVEDLMEHVQGPDFPTGGLIMGREGLLEAYQTGRGRLYLRAKAEVVENNGRETIIVSEIPFQVNKARMIERIAGLVRDKKLQGISELRDESDKDGLRIVIEIKRNEMGEVVLNNLWKHSQLEIAFGFNLVALDNGRPRLLGLKRLLASYLEHRRNVVIRRTRHRLIGARARGHVLEGLAIALANIDPIIEAIRHSADQQEATAKLLSQDWKIGDVSTMLERAGASACRPDDLDEDYGVMEGKGVAPAPWPERDYRLSTRQTKAILELRLHRLTGLEQDQLRSEYAEVLERITQLIEILENPVRLKAIIAEEITDMRDRFGDERRTIFSHDRRDLSRADLITPENRILTLSRLGYAKAQPLDEYRAQRRGGVGKAATAVKEDDVVEHIVLGNTHDPVLFFTDRGKVYRLLMYEIPVADRGARGRPINNLLPLDGNEQVTSLLSLSASHNAAHVFMATAQGVVKKTPLAQFESIMRNGKIALSLSEGDRLIGTALSSGENNILLATNSGQVIRFDEKAVRSMGRTARGVRGIHVGKLSAKAKKPVKVISLIIPEDESQMIFVSAKGYGKRCRIANFRFTNRGGQGVIGMGLSPKTGDVVAVRRMAGTKDLALITDTGTLVRIRSKDIRSLGRSARGVKIARLKPPAKELVDCIVVEEQEVVPSNQPSNLPTKQKADNSASKNAGSQDSEQSKN